MPTRSPHTPTANRPDATRRIGQATLGYFTTLFDFSFTKFITVQMFPVLYGVILTASFIGALYLTIEAFFTGWIRGLFYLFVAAPIGFITVATITRALMEFYIVVFRIAENADEIRAIAEKFSGLSQSVESMKDWTRLIPFWKNAGSRQGDDEENSSNTEKSRRKKDVNWPY